jgi:nucleoside 2-deoxyribosyltransferase
VASPLGFTEAGRDYYRQVLLPSLASLVEPIDPWALADQAELGEARAAGRVREMLLTIGQRNAAAIRESELLVAVLDGQEPDAGTAAELGYAAALGRPCFGLRSDLRTTGEEGVELNLQLEFFLLENGGGLLTSLPDLLDALRAWKRA